MIFYASRFRTVLSHALGLRVCANPSRDAAKELKDRLGALAKTGTLFLLGSPFYMFFDGRFGKWHNFIFYFVNEVVYSLLSPLPRQYFAQVNKSNTSPLFQFDFIETDLKSEVDSRAANTNANFAKNEQKTPVESPGSSNGMF